MIFEGLYKFKEYIKTVYCKDGSYNKKCTIDVFYRFRNLLYYNGYIVHREDGPAIEYDDGDKEYWLKGKQVKEEDLTCSKCEINSLGTKRWKNWAGEYHRLDGPAFEDLDGNKEWFKNGLRHREDGPAIEWMSGDKYWLINGKYHREDGPAIEYASGDKTYWLNGIQVEKKDLPMNKKEEL